MDGFYRGLSEKLVLNVFIYILFWKRIIGIVDILTVF